MRMPEAYSPAIVILCLFDYTIKSISHTIVVSMRNKYIPCIRFNNRKVRAHMHVTIAVHCYNLDTRKPFCQLLRIPFIISTVNYKIYALDAAYKIDCSFYITMCVANNKYFHKSICPARSSSSSRPPEPCFRR